MGYSLNFVKGGNWGIIIRVTNRRGIIGVTTIAHVPFWGLGISKSRHFGAELGLFGEGFRVELSWHR